MSNYIPRRKFITSSLKTGVALSIGTNILESCSNSKNISGTISNFKTTLEQQPLPYAYNALEDVIDAQTMEIHYSKHAAAYCKNLKEAYASENVLTNTPVEKVLQNISSYSTKMRNNAGGHFNHQFFWQCMQPKSSNNVPSGKLLDSINKHFSNFDTFKKQFSDAAKTRFGSGWAWLYVDDAKNLKIASSPNQDNPLMDISDFKGTPLLALDVWEHAYYLKYQNKRADYIENWWQVVNWNFVNNNLI